MAREDFERRDASARDAEQRRATYEAWDLLGPETKGTLLDLLGDDWSFESKRVLDFGCGTGRTLRHFVAEAEAGAGEFWGVDVDAAYVAEMQARCPPMHAARCEPAPPLALEAESFDLAWAISVFTHLTGESLPWLLELHRLLKPGGLLIATYIGRWNSEFVAGEPWDASRVGMNILQHTQSWDRGGPTVLMADWWVRAHWGRAFEILDVRQNVHNMDWVLMRKRAVALTTEDLERPADDPREYLAARHNTDQVRRELELTQAVYSKMLADLRRDYEGSLSWQVTRPLRAAATRARALRSRRRLT